jgi:hypothetical protein
MEERLILDPPFHLLKTEHTIESAEIEKLPPYSAKKRKELHPFFSSLCFQAAELFNYKVSDETVVHVEHKDHNFGDQPYYHGLGIHQDSDEYPNTYTVIYYYHVDDGILGNHLNFYRNPGCFFNSCIRFQDTNWFQNNYLMAQHIPKTGDIVAFDDVYHEPGTYKSNSTKGKRRAFVALFVGKTV